VGYHDSCFHIQMQKLNYIVTFSLLLIYLYYELIVFDAIIFDLTFLCVDMFVPSFIILILLYRCVMIAMILHGE